MAVSDWIIYTELAAVVLPSSVFVYHQSEYQFFLDSPVLSHCDTVPSSLLGPLFSPEWLTIDPLEPTNITLVHITHQVLLWELDNAGVLWESWQCATLFCLLKQSMNLLLSVACKKWYEKSTYAFLNNFFNLWQKGGPMLHEMGHFFLWVED